MDDRRFEELLDKYLVGELDDQESRLLETFISSFQKDDEVWNVSSLGDEEEKKKEILSSIKKEIAQSKKQRSLWFYTSRIAASILLLIFIGLGLWFTRQEEPRNELITKTTQWGQKSNIVLSDGTHVKLNSGSTISYPVKFKDDTRTVYLEGEAFFEVVENQNQPFIVSTPQLQTRVLGTSFNISAFKGQPQRVTVATGKVSVSEVKTSREVILTPGNQAQLKDDLFLVEQVDLSKQLAWRNGIIHFDKITLKEAVQTLERWYNITIELRNEQLGECTIRGKYKEENLINILESLKFVQGIDYQFQDSKKVIISGNGCSN